MGLTRRDFLTLGLGAAAALPLTPVPWKLLDDTAKWSQNWSWIPRPPGGERSVRHTACTLCPAGCGIAARCVGKNVIGISPLPGHPVSLGILCPYAFGAHQLPYHRARITTPLHHGNPASMDAVAAEIAGRVKAGTIGILDERPGRAVSQAYQRIAASHGGLYVVADRSETTTLQFIARGWGRNVSDLGFAFEKVPTLVSFGAPVLESWATPGRVLTLWKQARLAIVQVEAGLSKSAALASQWLPVRAGSEEKIAGLLAGTVSLAEAVEATGVSADKLAGTLRFIGDRGPVLAVSGGGLPEPAERAIAALNASSGAVVARTTSTPVQTLSQVPRASLDVLFVDHGLLGGSVPYEVLRPKLRPDGILVSLSPYRAGASALANYLIPTPAFAERLDEAPTPWDAVSPSYSLAPALLSPPPGVASALDFIHRVAGAGLPPEALMRARLAGLFAAKRGDVFTFADRSSKPVGEFKSAADFYNAFDAGACWIDPGARAAAVTYRLNSGEFAAKATTPVRGTAISPPLFTKLDQESPIGRV